MRKALLESGGMRILVIFMEEILAELCPAVMWEAEPVSTELGYTVKEICMQSVEDVSWLLLAAYSNMQE